MSGAVPVRDTRPVQPHPEPPARAAGRTCPWCLGRLERAARQAPACPRCGRARFDAQGLPLRPIDVRFDRLVAEQATRFDLLIRLGPAVAGVALLPLPLLHLTLTPLLVVPLLLAATLISLNLFLYRPARRTLGPTRRLFHRWLARLGVVWVGAPLYSLSTIPVLGALIGAGTFAGLAWALHHYTLWSLGRERDRRPLAVWERVTLIVLTVLLLIVLNLLLLLTVLVGWGLNRLFG